MSNDFTQPVTFQDCWFRSEDQNASAEYVCEQLHLPGALEIIKQSGYKPQPTDQSGWLFVHPDYGSAYCQTERDVLDFAEAMIAARESMRGTMEEAGLTELTDEEIDYISGHW